MNKRRLFFYSNLIISVLFFNLSLFGNNPSGKSFNKAFSMSCQDLVQLTFDANCEVEVLPEHLLTSPLSGNYTIEVYHNLNLLPPTIGVQYAFKLLSYTITSEDTGNSCSGNLMAVDFTAPIFDCSQDPIQISCGYNPDSIPEPTLVDNCTQSYVFLSNELWYDTDYCDDGKKGLIRTYAGVDYYGNVAEDCVQLIEVNREQDVDFPNDVIWSCDQYNLSNDIIDTLPLLPPMINIKTDTQALDLSVYGLDSLLYHVGSGVPSGLTGTLCDFSYSYSDMELEGCGDNKVIIRTWLVLDWCTNEIILTNSIGEDNIQFIAVSDLSPPQISIADTLYLNAEENGSNENICSTMGFIPPPTVSDNCSSFEIRIFSSVGELEYQNGENGTEGGFIPWPGLSLGMHTIEYRVEDVCGNETIQAVSLQVVDNSNPVMVTVPSALVSLNEMGLNEVLAFTFDQGSFDNCCLDYFEIKKLTDICNISSNLTYSNAVQFCCEEVGLTTPVIVRAVDCFGNTNEAIIQVLVQDNLSPKVVSCPGASTLSCDVYQSDYQPFLENGDQSVLDSFGQPEVEDNCFFAIDYSISAVLDECNEGYIERIWNALDAEGNISDVCTQQIFIEQQDNWGVQFQNNLILDCLTDTLGVYVSPIVFNQGCGLTASAFNDIIFDNGLNSCYSFFREWTVINWCTYDVFVGNLYPDISELDAQEDFNGDGFIDSLVFKVATGPNGDSDGIIQFTQVINIIDDTPPVVEAVDQSFCFEESNCHSTFFLEEPIIQDCSNSTTLFVESDLPGGSHLGPYTNVPEGIYTVSYEVVDECDNSTIQTVNITVSDCTAPTALCTDAVYQISANDSVLVYAHELVVESVDNCTDILAYQFIEGEDSSALKTFLCGEEGEYDLAVLVNDENGNSTSCSSTVSIVDTLGNCLADDLELAGAVMTEGLSFIESVEVVLEELELSSFTNNEGYFEFGALSENDTLTLKPSLDGNISQGVTTLDVVKIKLHILQVEVLDSPYKLIAADVNNSGTISTIDIVALRKVILGIDDSFPNNKSWRFVPMDFEFENPTNPFAELIPNCMVFDPLQWSNTQSDFYAVKVGDVNNSIDNYLGTIQNRTNNDTYPIIISDQDLVAGQFYTLPIQTKLTTLLGLQGQLSFDMDAVEILGCEHPESFDYSYVNHQNLCTGQLTFAWDQFEGSNIFDVLGRELRFIAKRNCRLSDVISLESSFLNEAYLEGGSSAQLVLNFNKPFEFKIGPNPFVERFKLSVDNSIQYSSANLKLYDMNGRLILEQPLDLNNGEASTEIKVPDHKGILIYELHLGSEKKSGRLLAL